MNLPKGFRYKSDWDTFCAVVDAAEILIKSKALFLLFGFEADVTFQELYSEKEFDSIGFPVDKRTFDKIMHREVLYLINMKVMEANAADGLSDYLDQQPDVRPEERAEIIEVYQKKVAYVEAHLLPDDGVRRSDFKVYTTSQKIRDLDWDICKYVFYDDSEQPYAQIKLSLMDELPDIRGMTDIEPEQVQFVCDAQDIGYLIERLKQIQDRLETL